jgi:hypothetical protein
VLFAGREIFEDNKLIVITVDEMSRRLDNLESAIQAGKGNDGK